jgi:acyl-homoserine-lactone acylase
MLNAHQQMSYEELIAAKHSTRALVADQLLDDLITAARESNSQVLLQAADVLGHWDRQYLAESRGAWLFGVWFEKWLERTIAKATVADPNYSFTPDQLVGSLFYTQPFDATQPLTTPYGLADIPLALLALQDAASELQATKGTLDVAWGEIARVRRGKTDLPGNGAGTALGVFREIVYEPDEDGKFKSFSGDTYIALIEFSQPVHAQVLTTYGNASQHPISEIGSQLPLAAKQQLRPAWRMLDEIEANLVMREILRR